MPLRKFNPLRGVPAGHEETGIGRLFVFGRRLFPREMAFGEGERGVEKGCAAPVDVAVGGPAVRGDAVASAPGETAEANGRMRDGDARKADAFRRHWRQIIVGCEESNSVWEGVFLRFWDIEIYSGG